MKFITNSPLLILIAISASIISGCKLAKTSNSRYEAAWEEVVRSESWEQSLNQQDVPQYLAEEGTEEGNWLVDSSVVLKAADPFVSSYDSWVNQAYYKIIIEAEAADARIKSEWDRFMADHPEAASSSDENVRKIMTLYKKKYQSHKTMLEGLKSWNAFENYGSDDLIFFKQEYENIVRAMHRDGRPEQDIVGYLVYKLADLYHLDEDFMVD